MGNFDDLLQIAKLILLGPFFALLIVIDRYIFATIRNPFVAFPRSVKELTANPKDFFDFIAANCVPGTLPRGAKFLRMENRGGAEWEPDKSVVKARIFYTDPSSSSSGQQQQQLDIFVKMPTAREYGVFFKTLISVFSSETKEVQFYNTVWPELNKIARERKILSADGKEELFKVPRNVVSKWSRLFERSIAVSHCIDDSKWHSRPDWKSADDHPQIATHMISTICRMHGLTFDCLAEPDSTCQPDDKVLKLRKALFSETHSVKWIGDILSLYISKQPPSVHRIWQAIVARCAKEPATISHGDFRMGNQLFNCDYSDVIVTDWEANSLTVFMWDLAYCIFAAFSPDVRRKREKELLALYSATLRNTYGIVHPSLEAANMWEMYRVAQVLVHFFSWGISQFGGVGETQGNSSGDMKKWAANLGAVIEESLKDPNLHKYLRCEESVVREYCRDLEAKVALQ